MREPIEVSRISHYTKKGIWMLELFRSTETWKSIKGYEGLYEISSYGRVKGLVHNIIRKQNTSTTGYFQIRLSKNGMPGYYQVHRLIALAFIPNIEGKPHINHIDANKKNNNINNLEWVTPMENVHHAIRLELHPHTRYHKVLSSIGLE